MLRGRTLLQEPLELQNLRTFLFSRFLVLPLQFLNIFMYFCWSKMKNKCFNWYFVSILNILSCLLSLLLYYLFIYLQFVLLVIFICFHSSYLVLHIYLHSCTPVIWSPPTPIIWSLNFLAPYFSIFWCFPPHFSYLCVCVKACGFAIHFRIFTNFFLMKLKHVLF